MAQSRTMEGPGSGLQATRISRTGRPEGPAVPEAGASRSGFLIIFYICMLPPFYFFIGGVQLSPHRLLMLAVVLPCLFKLLSGAAGRIRGADIFMMLYGFWMIVTLVYNHGLPRFPFAAVTVVELVGGYLAGRTLIRTAAAYRTFIRYLLFSMMVLVPVALVELFTDRNLLQEIFSPFFGTYSKAWSSYGRLGMERVMAGFAHPILYGLYCSMALGAGFVLYQERIVKALSVIGFALGMTFMSLSAGPLLAAVAQIGLLLWGRITGNKWRLLAILTAFGYVTVDLLSNRTPITIAISYITFNADTAWARVNVFHFGIREVWANPLFGIGLHDWARPSWLTGSVDNFWLLTAMRHGIPGFLFLFGGLLLHCRSVWQSQIPSARLQRYRRGYLITVMSLFLTLATVHIWGEVSVFVMFFIGAGGWFVDAASREPAEDGANEAPLRPGTAEHARTPRSARAERPSAEDRPAAGSIGRNSRSGGASGAAFGTQELRRLRGKG